MRGVETTASGNVRVERKFIRSSSQQVDELFRWMSSWEGAMGCQVWLVALSFAMAVTTAMLETSDPGGNVARDVVALSQKEHFLEFMEEELHGLTTRTNLAEWAYETNLNNKTLAESLDNAAELAELEIGLAEDARELLQILGGDFKIDERRRLNLLSRITAGTPSSKEDRRRLMEIVSKMSATYSTATDSEGRPLDPDLEQIMSTSRDEQVLRKTWAEWREAVGPEAKDLFEEYVRLSNLGAKDTGFSDMGEVWRSRYDMDSDQFGNMVAECWEELRVLYEELHCFVRTRLIRFYGDRRAVDESGRIYAHLLGNMWAQEWQGIYDLVTPFPERSMLDFTKQLTVKGYSEKSLVETAEKFYKSLGFPSLPESFWKRSMFLKPTNRSVVCHPSAWDLDGGHDVRLKMCMRVNQEDFITVHHELGHIYYYMLYRNQSYIFRDGANDGFHEAVGDTIALSAFTESYLAHLNLVPAESQRSERDKYEDGINYLMNVALQKVSFLPYGYLIDLFRWDAFSEKASFDELNKRYWKLREDIQGVAPPVTRSEADFDPVCKFHVAANVPYMRYFLAAIYQFQFHDAMCQLSGFEGPLHECSVFSSKEAGVGLEAMLSKGSSLPWQQTIALLTGNSTLDPQPMLRYFQPLREFLQEANREQRCGWGGREELQSSSKATSSFDLPTQTPPRKQPQMPRRHWVVAELMLQVMGACSAVVFFVAVHKIIPTFGKRRHYRTL